MRDTLIVFFPPAPEGLPIANGHILAFIGDQAQAEFDQVDSRSTDEYDLDPFYFPGAGIFVWEGVIVDGEHPYDLRTFEGKWRPAAADDLFRAGLIK